LLDLLVQFATSEEAELSQSGVRVRSIGRVDRLPPHQRKALSELERRTAGNARLSLNIAINYGARTEMADAARAIADEVKSGVLDVAAISEDVVASHLYTAHIPDPDILIRTGGEMRLSNFVLWQLAYTEIWVTDRFWPDFGRDDLVAAVAAYQKRARRFGGS
jgi:undecaprenyl diphosphate synthase